jgi:hypothetical protein
LNDWGWETREVQPQLRRPIAVSSHQVREDLVIQEELHKEHKS